MLLLAVWWTMFSGRRNNDDATDAADPDPDPAAATRHGPGLGDGDTPDTPDTPDRRNI